LCDQETGVGGITEVVEYLPNKCKAWNSNPCTIKKKKKKEGGSREEEEKRRRKRSKRSRRIHTMNHINWDEGVN
jgi:hypothetical protein